MGRRARTEPEAGRGACRHARGGCVAGRPDLCPDGDWGQAARREAARCEEGEDQRWCGRRRHHPPRRLRRRRAQRRAREGQRQGQGKGQGQGSPGAGGGSPSRAHQRSAHDWNIGQLEGQIRLDRHVREGGAPGREKKQGQGLLKPEGLGAAHASHEGHGRHVLPLRGRRRPRRRELPAHGLGEWRPGGSARLALRPCHPRDNAARAI
mmetsp:Transcript_21834/g.70715  ORF Transcript_21834/g.70715 Transcript_21834/m.70715 type:complete len:208 (+) Transcript_21834:647-1270(+)